MANFQVLQIRHGLHEIVEDEIADEAALAIELSYGPALARQRILAVITMRTPGHDDELALGWLCSERHIQTHDDVLQIQTLGQNRILCELHPNVKLEIARLARTGFAASSCGICGTTWLEDWADKMEPIPPAPPLDAATVWQMVDNLREAQSLFQRTGGVHAAGSFTTMGKLQFLREDIGRHNALDKLIGCHLNRNEPPGPVVVITSRAGFEIVQKCAMARVPILIAVGSPTSLAIETARMVGLSLIGFVREDRMNVYTGTVKLTD